MKIRTRALIIFILVSFLPIFFIILFNYYNVKQNLLNREKIYLKTLNNSHHNIIEDYFDLVQREILHIRDYYRDNILESLDYFSSQTQEKISAPRDNFLDFYHLQQVFGSVSCVELVDINGLIVDSLASNGGHEIEEVGTKFESDIFAAVSKLSRQEVAFNYFRGEYAGQNDQFFILSAPVFDDNNNLRGAVVFKIRPEIFFNFLKDSVWFGDSGETLFGFPVDKDLVFINDLRFGDVNDFAGTVFSKNSSMARPMRNAVDKIRQISIEKDYRNQDVLAVSDYLEDYNIGLVTKIDMKELLLPVRRLSYAFIFLGIICLLLVSIIATIISKKIFQPLTRLQEIISSFGDRNFVFRDDPRLLKRSDEIGSLYNAFFAMTEKISSQAKDLEKYNEKLQRQVDQKTNDLHVANKKLTEINFDLESRVKERTAELEKLKTEQAEIISERTKLLQEKIEELSRLNNFMVDRELKMAELKRKIRKVDF